jgi:hypothetical protein
MAISECLYSSRSEEWPTPQDFFDRLNEEFHFTLDPCATAKKRGVFENEIAILMGSNSEFLKETRQMATWLDVERLYLSWKNYAGALN